MSLRFFVPALTLLGLVLTAPPAFGWDEHTIYSRPAFSKLPEVTDYPDVEVESIEAFLEAEQQALVSLLDQEESWAVQNVPVYMPLPEALVFQATGDSAELRDRFLRAIRVNPLIKLALYTALPPGQSSEEPLLSWSDITTLSTGGALAKATLVALQPGDRISALETLSAASDEPDYGMDLGVWQDNDSEWGASYGFGEQPFGNPKLEFGAQAPFHMGFYHEAGIIYKLASFLQQTYPEYRIHLFQTLSRHAFETGHDYWGWRFLGWATHYIEDLAQPYHAQVLPGVSVIRMLWINTLSVVGISGPKDNAVQLVSNRHLALESYVHDLLLEEQVSGEGDLPLTAALADMSTDAGYGDYTASYPRDVLTVESVDRSKLVDHLLEKTFPERLVDDPEYLFGETEPDLNVLVAVREETTKGTDDLDALLREFMLSIGAHARNFVRASRAGLPVPAPLPELEETEDMDPDAALEGEPAEATEGAAQEQAP